MALAWAPPLCLSCLNLCRPFSCASWQMHVLKKLVVYLCKRVISLYRVSWCYFWVQSTVVFISRSLVPKLITSKLAKNSTSSRSFLLAGYGVLAKTWKPILVVCSGCYYTVNHGPWSARGCRMLQNFLAKETLLLNIHIFFSVLVLSLQLFIFFIREFMPPLSFQNQGFSLDQEKVYSAAIAVRSQTFAFNYLCSYVCLYTGGTLSIKRPLSLSAAAADSWWMFTWIWWKPLGTGNTFSTLLWVCQSRVDCVQVVYHRTSFKQTQLSSFPTFVRVSCDAFPAPSWNSGQKKGEVERGLRGGWGPGDGEQRAAGRGKE